MWFWLALESALISGANYVLLKYLVDRVSSLVVSWAIFFFTLPILGTLIWFQGTPKLDERFWIGVITSGVIFSLIRWVSLHAFKASSLSKLLPLNATGIMFTYIFGLFMLEEKIAVLKLVGLMLVMTGLYTINITKFKASWWGPLKALVNHRPSLLYLLAIVGGGIITAFDKLALVGTHPRSPILVIFAENSISSMVLGLILLKRGTNYINKQIRGRWWILIGMALLYLMGGIPFFYGLAQGPAALVSGIKKLQIVFGMLIAWLALSDKPQREQWVGAILMILGAVLIKV